MLNSLPHGYYLLRELGEGTQGHVVLAQRESTGAVVAIKILTSQLLSDPRAVSMFREEARLLQRVGNPHVARLYDYIEKPDGSAIVMEAVNGTSLRELLRRRENPLEPVAALTILKGSLLGLAAAHACGVVHRDYKPANVIVQGDGQTKLIDFGVAGLIGSSSTSGTPAYMAPEQWQGEPASPATDLYAATCVFFECLTGWTPFRAQSVRGLQVQHLTSPIPIEHVTDLLRPLIARGMAKDPGQRLWDATEFIAELEVVATEKFGRDWEKHGVLALGASAAALAATFPLAMIGSTLVTPGASAIGATLTQGTTIGRGLLGKLGGAKAAAGITAGTATAALVLWLLWPSPPDIGGESRSVFAVSFKDPGRLLNQPNLPAGGSGSPRMDIAITVSPSRVRPGTPVKVVAETSAVTPNGVRYLPGGILQCMGKNSVARGVNRAYQYGIGGGGKQGLLKGQEPIWLYRISADHKKGLPTGTPIKLISSKNSLKSSTHYNRSACADEDRFRATFEFRVPHTSTLPSGQYFVSPYDPPRITRVKVRGSANSYIDIAPESFGAQASGRLPALTVLPS